MRHRPFRRPSDAEALRSNEVEAEETDTVRTPMKLQNSSGSDSKPPGRKESLSPQRPDGSRYFTTIYLIVKATLLVIIHISPRRHRGHGEKYIFQNSVNSVSPW